MHVSSNSTASPLTLEFLRWLASHPRTYAETMEAWRTSCPRQAIWEDALNDGLIQFGHTPDQPHVSLTARGRALLTGQS